MQTHKEAMPRLDIFTLYGTQTASKSQTPVPLVFQAGFGSSLRVHVLEGRHFAPQMPTLELLRFQVKCRLVGCPNHGPFLRTLTFGGPYYKRNTKRDLAQSALRTSFWGSILCQALNPTQTQKEPHEL